MSKQTLEARLQVQITKGEVCTVYFCLTCFWNWPTTLNYENTLIIKVFDATGYDQIYLSRSSLNICCISQIRRQRVLGHIYNMKNQFWAGLGSQAVLVKKKVWGRLWATFEARFFMFSWAKNNFNFFFENIVAFTLKKISLAFWAMEFQENFKFIFAH